MTKDARIFWGEDRLATTMLASSQQPKNQVYCPGKVGRGVEQRTMQSKVRHHRIRLYPYDMFTVSSWSLPPISPGPTPLPLAILSQRAIVKLHKPPLRKIHLLPLPRGQR
jgi:hypothetical protein